MGENGVYLRWIRSDNTPLKCQTEDQILNAQLFFGENSWAWWDKKCICVMLVPGSRFLVNSVNTNYNPYPNTKSEPDTNLAPVHTAHSNLLILLNNLSNLNHIYIVRVTGHVMKTFSCF